VGSAKPTPDKDINIYLLPCSCGTTFSVAPDYDRHGSHWTRFLTCPGCGKKHDPRHRLVRMAYRPAKFWTVDEC
jgi:hypothetical protein